MTATVSPRISMLPGDVVESWHDPEVEAYYRQAYRTSTPPPTSLAMESHQPAVMLAWCRFWWATFQTGGVAHELKELIRVQMAEDAGCFY